MKWFLITALGLAFSSCASGQLKQQSGEISRLQKQVGDLNNLVKTRDESIAALEIGKQDSQGKVNEFSDKLKASQAQIDSLTQSNKDLSLSIEAGKGELSNKVKELVAGKDELSRKLANAEREKASLKNSKDKLTQENMALSGQNKTLDAQVSTMEAQRENERLARQQLQDRIDKEKDSMEIACQKEVEAGLAKIEAHASGLNVTLQESLLFETQQAKLTKNALGLLDRVGRILHDSGWRVRVEAHSDNSPFKRELFGGFSNNWDLTSARAAAVARYLHEHAGLDPRLISATGLGEFRPINSNDNPEGQSSNRRVILAIEVPPDL